jgi:hypothetical protein
MSFSASSTSASALAQSADARTMKRALMHSVAPGHDCCLSAARNRFGRVRRTARANDRRRDQWPLASLNSRVAHSQRVPELSDGTRNPRPPACQAPSASATCATTGPRCLRSQAFSGPARPSAMDAYVGPGRLPPFGCPAPAVVRSQCWRHAKVFTLGTCLERARKRVASRS